MAYSISQPVPKQLMRCRNYIDAALWSMGYANLARLHAQPELLPRFLEPQNDGFDLTPDWETFSDVHTTLVL